MKIAIIGGGASGITAAYLLSGRHEVDLFEKHDHLGGHVRTLNGNVASLGLDNVVHIENGVLGFHERSYPNVHRLMEHLGVDLIKGTPGAALFTPNSFTAMQPQVMKKQMSVLRPGRIFRTLRFFRAAKKHWRMLREERHADKEDTTAGENLPGHQTLRTLLKGILMLSFSTPWAEVDNLPAALTDPFLDALRSVRWSFVRGGVYAYMEKMIPSVSGRIHLGAEIKTISRSEKVIVNLKDGSALEYDKVVIATSPGQVLRLLDDLSDAEQRLFTLWQDRVFPTTAHSDLSVYGALAVKPKSPMDIIAGQYLEVRGYNTWMNEAYGLPADKPTCFAYGLDDMIAPEKIIDKWDHTVPVYTRESYRTRTAILQLNGRNNTFFAGAYLGNGLHEGAISSAMAVSAMLGGREL